MPLTLKTKARLAIPLFVLLIALAFLTVSYVIATLLRVPLNIGIPTSVRILGGLIFLLGLGIIASVFRLRKPGDVLVSTYVTLSKARRRIPPRDPAERTETLTIAGLYSYSRNPLYLGVILLWVAAWLITDVTFLIITTILFYLWFNFVIIPLEETELIALFGDQYRSYMTKVPRIIPFTKLGK